MNTETQSRLLAINRDFYERFARQFADARSTGQASLQRALAVVEDGHAVLDVGCGDGRAARALDEMGRRASYLGVDASRPFIALAQARAAGLAHVSARFSLADVALPTWHDALASRQFDAVLALAVLHHIPGQSTRRRILGDLAGLLAPDGRLVVSTWQFMNSARLRQRIVPWSVAGMAESQLDAGDYLLDWRRGGYGLRYCCLIGEADLCALCHNAGLAVEDAFLADGNLNLYVVARRAG